MIEITIKKAKLTKSLFAQLVVISPSDYIDNETDVLGFVLNVKHPDVKSNKIIFVKREKKYYVFPFYENVSIDGRVVIFDNDSKNSLNFSTKEEAQVFFDIYTQNINCDMDQIFI